MTLDTETQRAILLQLINAAQVPGSAVEAVAALKVAIVNASIVQQDG